MLALVIGNSHLHWAWFSGDTLQSAWDTPYLAPPLAEKLIHYQFDFGMCAREFQLPIAALSCEIEESPELWIASVVPEQTALWQTYALSRIITLEQVPLRGLYPTFGVDRALALFGAIETLGSPVLVIDAGTALTFSAADDSLRLVGGAILPGLGLQFRSLSSQTAALPLVDMQELLPFPTALPPRWGTTTPSAIQSGVVYSLLAGIRDFAADWVQKFPSSVIALTGGDAELLLGLLQTYVSKLASRIVHDPHLVFKGLRSL